MTRSNTEHAELHKVASLHGALVRLKERGPQDHLAGICYNLRLFQSGPCDDTLQQLFPLWPLFSGSTLYPVPSCKEDYSPEGMFEGLMDEDGDFWDTSTEYGRLRWQLLDWLIEMTSPEHTSKSPPAPESP